MKPVDYSRVAKAIKFYERLGYEYVDTPWVVSHHVKAVTFPGVSEACRKGYLVGSAEQGFIHLMVNGLIKPGLYVSAGPCFRFDDVTKSVFHHPYFFKVELCEIGTTDFSQVLADAHAFLGGTQVQTNDGIDLELNGLEIGSYGYRVYSGHEWAYGTGLAEPRFSQALALSC